MSFRKKQENFHETQVVYENVQISNDGFETSIFADLVLFPKSRACLLMNLVDMVGDEFVERSKKKNILLDYWADFSGISVIQNRDGFEGDDVLVIGQWEIYAGNGNRVIEMIVEHIRKSDEEFAWKRKMQPPVIPVYSCDSEVATQKVHTRKNVSSHVIERVRKRGYSIFGGLQYQMARLQSACGGVFRKIGIVCAVGAALWSIFVLTGVADMEAVVIRVIVAMSAVLAAGSMIFSGGLLGVLKAITIAIDLTSGNAEEAIIDGEFMTTSQLYNDNTGAFIWFIGGIFHIAIILMVFVVCLAVVFYLPIIPVFMAQGERWMEEMDERAARDAKMEAAKKRKQALEEMQRNM